MVAACFMAQIFFLLRYCIRSNNRSPEPASARGSSQFLRSPPRLANEANNKPRLRASFANRGGDRKNRYMHYIYYICHTKIGQSQSHHRISLAHIQSKPNQGLVDADARQDAAPTLFGQQPDHRSFVRSFVCSVSHVRVALGRNVPPIAPRGSLSLA